MRVLVHDSLSKISRHRERFIVGRLEQQLERFTHAVRRMCVRLEESGPTGQMERHCHIAVDLGSMGDVVVDVRGGRLHPTLMGAIRQVTRNVQRRVDRRIDRRTIRDL